MQLNFFKYQGTGNDFILIDNQSGQYDKLEDQTLVAGWCDRRFGIGADGLIFLNSHPTYDFEMRYFNADGNLGSMCGNGGRCVVAFAHFLNLIGQECTFLAADGLHEAKVPHPNWIELKMNSVEAIEEQQDFIFMDTGSPHYVEFVEDIDGVNVFERGRAIRYNERFKVEGTNVNFVEVKQGGIRVATYERGVEAETFSCGTGVTAAAIAHVLQTLSSDEKQYVIPIWTKGGELEVRFELTQGQKFRNIWLCGPANPVFKGLLEL